MTRALLLSSVLALHVHAAPFSMTLPKAVAPRPNTNRFSLLLAWDLPAGFGITNTTVFSSNQTGTVTATNFGAVTSSTIRWLSATNRYTIWARCTDSNGLTSEPSNIILWRPKVNTFLTVATLPAGPSFCVTNPAGVQFFRVRSTGTNGTFESASGPRGPWSSFRGLFAVPSGLRYRLTSSLSNDLARILECERKE